MPTPLYDALTAFAAAAPARFHMPGHKGRGLPSARNADWAALDFTELPPTGDLYAGGGPIEEAEGLWARAYGFERCLFLTGGSTQGLHAALTLACAPGDSLLMDRGCHRSVYNALALLDLRPAFLFRETSPAGVPGPIAPQAVEDGLTARPDIHTVCITSPTYYGVLSDIPGIAAVCHAHGAKLVVDAAHGAHLNWLGDPSLSAADLVVTSAHKTLPAPGQTALLLAHAPLRELRRAGAVYGSSSPSYPLMAALDLCRDYMEGEGRVAYRACAGQVAALRRDYPSLADGPLRLDPCRFVLRRADGFAAQTALEGLGVWPEMADRDHVVFICTCADAPADFARLRAGLDALEPWADSPPLSPGPPAPETVLSPRQALFSHRETLPLRAAEGRIGACQIAPYPPGVPVVAPGERVTKKIVAYLAHIGYNMVDDIEVVVRHKAVDV